MLEPDDDALIASSLQHVLEAIVADRENVRRQFPDLLPFVHSNLLCGVDRNVLIGIHCQQNRAHICLEAIIYKKRMRNSSILFSHFKSYFD